MAPRNLILETPHLVGCSCAAVVSVYQKCCSKGQMMNRHPAIVHSNRWATVWQITSSYNSRAMYHSTQFISALCMQACIADHPHANCTQSPRTHELGPRSLRLNCGWLEESGLVWRIKIPGASRQWLSADMLITNRGYGTWMHCGADTGGVILWAMFSWDTLGPIIPTAQSLTAVRYLNIVADQVHPFTATVFLAG